MCLSAHAKERQILADSARKQEEVKYQATIK